MNIIQEIVKMGAKEWENEKFHRFYFNNLAELYGLECEFYNTGNVQSAYLDGDLISNSSAKKILMHLAGTKVWYDVKKNCFDFKVDCASDEYAKCIVENLKEKFMKN